MKSKHLLIPGLLGGALLAGFAWHALAKAPAEGAAPLAPLPPSSSSSVGAAGAAAAVATAASEAVEQRPLVNLAAYIPPQCYAQTRGENAQHAKTVHNSCFTCHRESRAPNYVNDEDVQTTLSFARFATENHWQNFLHRPEPAAIDDAALLARVRTSNYQVDEAKSKYAREHGSYAADAYFHFDEDGFDHAPDGHATGWRAFAYAPFPGMFWPTNGSAGDVLIRLPEAFRQNDRGEDDLAIYRLNFALLEAYIQERDVPIAPTDERAVAADLDGDGRLGIAKRIAFRWPIRDGRAPKYFGKASMLDPAGEGRIAAGLFPVGTEFLHTLRYLDIDDQGHVVMAARMKEVRYMKKKRWLTYSDLELAAQGEAREKQKSPDRLKRAHGDAEHGVGNGLGWVLQGYIEDREGHLRPQSFEETVACIGCHGGVGATTDSTFAFARKLGETSYRQGWYHWLDHGIAGVPEPRRKDGKGEYAHYLAQVGGGDDYRTNDEVEKRFFRADHSLDPEAVQKLSKDIATLIVPSRERALALNRAYLGIVQAQSFVQGREVTVGGEPHVVKDVVQDDATGIERAVAP